jgi:arginase
MLQLLGIPYDANSSFLKGPALAPNRIRLMDVEGSANSYSESGNNIEKNKWYHDNGDISFTDTNPINAFKSIKSNVHQLLQQNNKLICLGGDHSISYPIIEAHAEKYPNLHVLHFDAHADLYDNFDNNPYSHASPFARIMEQQLVASLTQVGIRTLNTHQQNQAQKFSVQIIAMKNFNLDFINNLEGPLYVSVDLDVLDPAFAPGVSHHEPGGLSTRQLLTCIQQIQAPIIGADIVEYNPTRDINNMTAMVAYKVFKELADKMAN